jgi:hypothetical protein
MAEMLRQQELARLSLERGDIAAALGAQRALAMPGLELQADAAAREEERQRRLAGAAMQAAASLGASGVDAFGSYMRKQDEMRKNPLGF